MEIWVFHWCHSYHIKRHMLPGFRELWQGLCRRSRARPFHGYATYAIIQGCVGFGLGSAVLILEFMFLNKRLSVYLALELQIIIAGPGISIWLILFSWSSNSSYKLIFQRLSLPAALFPNGLSSYFRNPILH